MNTRRLFWKALWTLIRYDLWLSRLGFRRVYQTVREWPVAAKACNTGDTDQICHAVSLACMWYPAEVLCLQRSIVTVCLLRDEGVPARMVIGARQLPFKSHAWVEVDGCIVNDKPHLCADYARMEIC
jgi:hypothetical protein